MIKVILASNSPRRRELLEEAGLEFTVVASPAEEIHDVHMELHALCEENARLKATAVAAIHHEAIVIGADTLVCIDSEPLGKPLDLEEAHVMLQKLSGRTHVVCTGVCVISPGGTTDLFHELTEVDFFELDHASVAAYFAVANPMDKAGAYGIQEHGHLIVKAIRGEYDNVMGLPVKRVMEAVNQVAARLE